MEQLIKVRPIDEHDVNYILSSWLKAYQRCSYFAKRIKKSVFYPGHEALIKFILDKPRTQTLVAYTDAEPAVIIGYCVTEKELGIDKIHWVYVRQEFKHMGVAKTLMQAAQVNLDKAVCTHWTYDLEYRVADETSRNGFRTKSWLTDKYPELSYDPYRI